MPDPKPSRGPPGHTFSKNSAGFYCENGRKLACNAEFLSKYFAGGANFAGRAFSCHCAMRGPGLSGAGPREAFSDSLDQPTEAAHESGGRLSSSLKLRLLRFACLG